MVGFILLEGGPTMDLSSYRNRPDWATEMRLHDGSVEVVKHCGTCLSVIPREHCIHCTDFDVESQAERAEHKKFIEQVTGAD